MAVKLTVVYRFIAIKPDGVQVCNWPLWAPQILSLETQWHARDLMLSMLSTAWTHWRYHLTI